MSDRRLLGVRTTLGGKAVVLHPDDVELIYGEGSTNDAEALTEQLADAAEIIGSMTEWMRCVIPSQVEPGTNAERNRLLVAARMWKAVHDG